MGTVRVKNAIARGFYPSPVVRDITGASFRNLQWWAKNKIVSPPIENHLRLYNDVEVVEVMFMKELRRRRVALSNVTKVLRCSRRQHLDVRLKQAMKDGRSLYLVTDGEKSSFLADRAEALEILIEQKKKMFVICVRDYAEKLRSLR